MPPSGNSDGNLDGILGRMIIESWMGQELSRPFRTSLRDRGNIPTPLEDDVKLRPSRARGDKLWIVDRILEPQTLPHFFEAICLRKFPDGQACELPCPTVEEIVLCSMPYSSWAPAPYNDNTGVPMELLMARIASFEFTSNLLNISKDLHSMKAGIWEGVKPLSSRQWVDKGLDKPENYREACQHISWVIKVFQYLNHRKVSASMRDTFNGIHSELKSFEDAINARRRQNGGEPNVQVQAVWTAYIRAHFSYITSRAHTWVIDRINRLRIPIIEDMRNCAGHSGDSSAQKRWELTDKIHDLLENSALADINILISMQGYNGVARLDDSDLLYGNPLPSTPLSGAHPEPQRRAELYHLRLRYLTRRAEQGGDPSFEAFQRLPPTFDLYGDVRTTEAQLRAQAQTRAEMRGEQVKLPNFWIPELRRRLGHNNVAWAYLGYRTSYQHNDENWDEFKKKFEADHKSWGMELGDIEDIRAVSKVHWLDTKELGINGEDPNAVKEHFKKFVKSAEAPLNIHDNMYLIANQDTINSYLKPIPEQGGFVLAIDVDFDPASQERPDESPGYDGTLRILTSLLWDDINPLMLLQTQRLEDLSPLAMLHPLRVYSGPVMPAMRQRWEALIVARQILFANVEKWRELYGLGAESSS